MTTRAELCAAALALVGTPFHPQGRVPGVGIDCIGVAICAARACGIAIADRTDYPMQPNGILRGELNARLQRVQGEPQAGDLLMMRFDTAPHHVALLIDGGRIVHAHMRARRTVVQAYTNYWRERTCGAFRFEGVA